MSDGQPPSDQAAGVDYRALFSAHPSPMWVYDLETSRFLDVNEAAVARYGISRQALLGMTVAAFSPELDIPTPADPAAGAVREPDTSRLRRHRLADGRTVPVEVTARTIELRGRSARLVVARDVTRRLETEGALPRAETLFRIAGQVGGLGGWRVDLHGMRVDWSDEVCAMHDVPPGYVPTLDEAIGFFAPEWRDRIRASFDACARDGTPFREEMELVTATGRRIWIRAFGEAVRDGRGRIVQVQGAATEITERKRDELLRSAEARILQMVSTACPLPDVLDAVVRAIEAASPGTVASILLLDADGRRARHGAAPHLPEAYVRAVDGEEIGPRAGSCGTAMYRRAPVVVTDIASDPLWDGYRALIMEHGLRACWSTPILGAAGAVLGSFALYYREARAPGAADRESVARAADLVRVAIERARADAAVKASEERFRQLAENIGEVFWITDPRKETMVYVSPAYETIWGRSCESLYRDPGQWLEAIHEADRPAVRIAVAGQAAGTYDVEYRIVRPDGSVRWIADRAFPVRDASGAVYRVVGSARDVSDRKAAESALRESEQRFQAVAAATTDVVWDRDLARGTVWWSEGLREAFGYEPAEFAASREAWITRIHPDDRERVAGGTEAAIARGDREWQAEYRLLHRDGRYRHVEDRARLVTGEDGAPARLVGGIRDVSEAHDAQAHIDDLRRRLETLVGEARVGILVHHGFVPVLANQELARLFGYDGIADILAMTDCRALFAEDERDRITGYNRVRMAGDEAPGFFILKGLRRDGSIITLENRAFPIQWGGRLSVCAMMVDVTERLELEERLRRSQRLEAVGQLTGGVAHDFNNLLQVIIGNAEFLAAALGHDAELRSMAELTLTAAERGADLTSRLLSFSRRQALAPRPTDVAARIAGMGPLLRRTLGEDVEIAIVAQGALWPGFVDAAQLETAILNLCLNARDAMPGGGKLTIETENVRLDADYAGRNAEVVPGPYVRVSVSDTGTGMPPDVAARAFEPFFTTKDVGKGNGLGLSMVFGFAKQSNGHAKIYSEPGHGTTVSLYVPRADGGAAEDEAAADDRMPGGSETVLVVEDDAMVRDQVAATLRSLGYRVVTASSGVEALAVAGTLDGLDLLFTDVVMPGGVDGRRLAGEMRARYPGLPVLFTSGYAQNAVVHHGRLDPGVHLLGKPYRRPELATMLRRVLDEAKGQPGRTG